MLSNKYVRWSLKILSAVISFLLIFLLIQPFFVPKYFDDSTTKGYSYLDKNSIDVLFLGASQMFCAVDAGMLTDEYNISSYDYGASSQNMTVTEYYFNEALKTQSPKLIMLEVSKIFSSDNEVEDNALSWNFDPMPASTSKYATVRKVSDDTIKTFKYSYAPLFLYHDRWNAISSTDVFYVLNPKKYINLSSRGFVSRDHVEPHEIAFFNDEYDETDIPEESKTAILNILEDCKKKNIKLVLFKAPVSNWTKGDSLSVKSFSEENDLEFIDLNESIKEIGIDENADFYNDFHLNTNGAEKTTKYLAVLLQSYLE